MPAAKAVGPYAIESIVARGATSVVYLARDTRSGERVALKTFALGSEHGAEAQAGAIAEARARFLREADAARRLRHPAIAALLDAGEAAGVAYLAIEPLAGCDLSRHTSEAQRLPAAQVARIAAQVADALAYAHRQGVVHRDVKAANVIYDAATDRAWVTDFGIARVADASHTRTGVLLGTPQCMAPELLAGRRADARSDLYALGVLLFELLCSRPPFTAAALGALIRQVANDTPPPLLQLRPELPSALGALVAALLAKDPALRPQDGAAVARELRAIAALIDADARAATGEVRPPAGADPR